jgi:hypothetical protein
VVAAGLAVVGFGGISLAVSNGRQNSGHSSQALVSASAHAGDRGSVRGLEATGSPDAPSGGGSGSSLPFTGMLAIPVLLAGVGLLGAGLVLRRRPSATTSA